MMKGETPLEILNAETQRINPAILLAEEFMRRDAGDLLSAEEIESSEHVLEEAKQEIETIRRQISAFTRSSPSPCRRLPIGF